METSSWSVLSWWLASALFVLRQCLPLLLPDEWERFHRLLSDNCSLLIYNVKLNVSLGPASSLLLQADRAVTRAATVAPHWLSEVPEWMPHVAST